jgi:hypothetical protein
MHKWLEPRDESGGETFILFHKKKIKWKHKKEMEFCQKQKQKLFGKNKTET